MRNQALNRLKTLLGGSTLALALSTTSVLLASDPAEATFRVCNRARQDVWLTLGYFDLNRDAWWATGWYYFNNEQCRTLHEPPQNLRYYYVHAQTVDGESEWASDNRRFCVRYGGEGRFNWPLTETCDRRSNGRLEGFLEIDTSSNAVRDRTFTLFVDDKIDDVSADNTFPPISYPRER